MRHGLQHRKKFSNFSPIMSFYTGSDQGSQVNNQLSPVFYGPMIDIVSLIVDSNSNLTGVGVSTDLTVKQRDQLHKLKQEGYFQQIGRSRHDLATLAVNIASEQRKGPGNPSYCHRGDRQPSSSDATQERDNTDVPNS